MGYCERFIQQIYAHDLSNHNSRLWSKCYIHISNISREIAKIADLHIGGHEKKLPVFKRLKNIVEVETFEVGIFFRMSQIVFFGYLLFDITFCDENF